MSPNSSSLRFYPLHITLLKFLEKFRRSHINENRTVCRYLPVLYDAPHIGDAGCRYLQHKPSSYIGVLNTFLESIAFSSEFTRLTALVNFDCTANEGH